MLTLILALMLTAAPTNGAGVTTTTTTRAALELLLSEVRDGFFPELAGLPLKTGTLPSSPGDRPNFFFQSNFDAGQGAAGTLALNIEINERIFDDTPSTLALRAVLAHELAHSLDYQQRYAADGARGLVALLPMLFWDPVQEEVERRADIVAVARGFGAGLLSYRVWLYARIDAEAQRDKRRVYYAPLELALLTTLLTRCPQVSADAIAHPPRSAREIVALNPTCF